MRTKKLAKYCESCFLALILSLTLIGCSSDVKDKSEVSTSKEVTVPGAELTTEEKASQHTNETNNLSSSEPLKVERTGEIYLYGEHHAKPKILEEELRLWKDYYHNEGMRHLFIENSYFTGELLNIWMKEPNDEILLGIYEDWEGSQAHSQDVYDFYVAIKKECPETIFHGTDVGHQHDTTGRRYLKYLEEHNKQDSNEYRLTIEAIDQGAIFYNSQKDIYRENTMVENFMREANQIPDEKIMGIYGAYHTNAEGYVDEDSKVGTMANQLLITYGDKLSITDLSPLLLISEPIRIDKITIGGKEYNASYFGTQDLTGFKDFKYREYWRLEDSYNDFKDIKSENDILPFDNYIMPVEKEQVFVIDYYMTDGSSFRSVYRADGGMIDGVGYTVLINP